MKIILFTLVLSTLFPTINKIEKVKIYGLHHQPLVAANLNGKKAYFLLDTGSDVTLLNLNDAKKYAFEVRNARHKKLELSGFSDEYSIDYLTAKNIKLLLGDHPVEIKYRVLDLSTVIESIDHSSNMKICGIIGSDMMKKYNFVIDYKAREVRFDAWQ